MIDVLKRIEFRLKGRHLLSASEQLILDAYDEIVKLRRQRRELANQAATLVETSDLRKKKDVAAKIRQLGDE